MLRGVVAVRREANGVAQLHGQVRGGDGAAQLHGHGRGGDGVMTTMHAWGGRVVVLVIAIPLPLDFEWKVVTTQMALALV